MPTPIFIVDSSPAVRRMVEQISTPEGFEVVGFHDGPAALEAARHNSPSIIIADYHLDNMTFSGFCKEINKLDNLAETFLVSLVNAADHPDESHLRALGVKAFIKKPFQSDDLLDVLQSVQHKETSNGHGFKRRAWPPTSTSTDTDDEEPPQLILSPDELETSIMEPSAVQPVASSSLTPPTTPVRPEDAIKGLVDQLLHSASQETEKKLDDLLPHVIEGKLASHIRPLVQQEVRAQLGNILSQEYLTTIIQPLVSQALPALIRKEIEASQTTIQHTVSVVVKASIGEAVYRTVQDQTEASINKHVPSMIREQMGSMDQRIKDEVRAAAMKQAPLIADDVVRTVAEQFVEQAVQRIVPDVAEQHVKAEITRLLETEGAPH